MHSLEFGWFLPTNGDTTTFADPTQIPQSMELFDRVARSAEQAGMEYILVPTQTICWEAWIASAMVVARSQAIKMLVAMRPGYINPVLLAKMISCFDQLSGGRICINLIAGASDAEATSEGIPYAKEERYEVMLEEIEILKRLWAGDGNVSFDGKYHQAEEATIYPPIFQKPHPKFYLGGGSRKAWEISAEHSSVHLFWGDRPENIAAQIGEIRKLAVAYGREEEIGFGMRLQIICREREEEAWEAARFLVAGVSDQHKSMVQQTFSDSVANQRMRELSTVENGMLGPNLWSGITKVRPGAGVAVVGSPEQCATTLQQFIDVGCHSFCLSGYPHDEEAERFGRLVRPLIMERNRTRPRASE